MKRPVRYRQFKERQSYEVPVYNGMEYDRYDTLATVHLVWLDEAKIVRGCSRLNPTDRPYMLKDLWSAHRRSAAALLAVCVGRHAHLRREGVARLPARTHQVGPCARLSRIWPRQWRRQIHWRHAELYLEKGLHRPSGWGAGYLGPERLIGGIPTRAGEVVVSPEALDRVRLTTGISESVLRNPCQVPLQPAVALG